MFVLWHANQLKLDGGRKEEEEGKRKKIEKTLNEKHNSLPFEEAKISFIRYYLRWHIFCWLWTREKERKKNTLTHNVEVAMNGNNNKLRECWANNQKWVSIGKKASHEVLHWSDTHIVLEWINQAHQCESSINERVTGHRESDMCVSESVNVFQFVCMFVFKIDEVNNERSHVVTENCPYFSSKLIIDSFVADGRCDGWSLVFC